MSLKVAVTGGIGSGKSVVCQVFNALGVPVYNADSRAKEMMNTDPDLRKALVSLLGNELYDKNGMRRKWLAEKMFGNDLLVQQVNKIVHPAVFKDFLFWSEQRSGFPYLIEEAALTFEAGGEKYFDKIIVVSAPEMTRINRVIKRDGVTEEEVRSRMKHQMEQTEKERRADYIIYNDDSTMILPQILALHAEFIKTS